MDPKGVIHIKPILLDFPQEFETDRLHLRCPLPGDGPALNAAIVESQAELNQWLPFADPLPSIEESEENVRRAQAKFLLREDLRLHLYEKQTGKFLGSSGLHRMNWVIGRFEIGYWIRTTEAGHGFITEAVNGVVKYAAQYLHATRLEIRCDPRNVRSRRVAERAGFHQEATLLGDDPDMSGNPSDTLIFAKIRLADGSWGYPSSLER